MRSIFRQEDYLLIRQRIESIPAGTPAQWGKMTVEQMVCHCSDSMREALGLRPTKDQSHLLSRSILKWASLYLLPEWPKGKLPTAPEYDQLLKGTSPISFDSDKGQLLRILEDVSRQPEWYRFHPHPFFGRLSRKEWGILLFKHLDHHLRQFSA